jgi:hypothetical protein
MTNGSNKKYFSIPKTKLNKFILQDKIVILLLEFTKKCEYMHTEMLSLLIVFFNGFHTFSDN